MRHLRWIIPVIAVIVLALIVVNRGEKDVCAPADRLAESAAKVMAREEGTAADMPHAGEPGSMDRMGSEEEAKSEERAAVSKKLSDEAKTKYLELAGTREGDECAVEGLRDLYPLPASVEEPGACDKAQRLLEKKLVTQAELIVQPLAETEECAAETLRDAVDIRCDLLINHPGDPPAGALRKSKVIPEWESLCETLPPPSCPEPCPAPCPSPPRCDLRW